MSSRRPRPLVQLDRGIARVASWALRLKGFYVFGRRVAAFGNFTVVHPENVSLGTGCAINHDVFILGHSRVSIGNNVILSAGATLIDGSLSADAFLAGESHYPPGHITIGDNVWIGARSLILPNVTIGPHSIVGAGSVVTKDVEPWTIVAGNPARILRRIARPSV